MVELLPLDNGLPQWRWHHDPHTITAVNPNCMSYYRAL
jgi:hypothetical protein